MFRAVWVLISMLITLSVGAQSSEFADEWVVDEHCIEPVSVPDDWTYEGVIVTQDEAGLRGIRADMDTSYFLAFDNDEQLLEMASFSPDGQWLVIPVGHYISADYVIPYYSTLEVTGYRIFRLYPHRELIDTKSWEITYAGTASLDSPVHWGADGNFIINPDSLENKQHLRVQPTGHTYQLLDYQGQVLFTLDSNRYQFGAFTLSPQSDQLAIIRIDHTTTPLQGTLLIGDINTHRLWETCLTAAVAIMQDLPAPIWSPDGESLAVNMDGQILAIEINARQVYPVSSGVGRVREWLSSP